MCVCKEATCQRKATLTMITMTMMIMTMMTINVVLQRSHRSAQPAHQPAGARP